MFKPLRLTFFYLWLMSESCLDKKMKSPRRTLWLLNRRRPNKRDCKSRTLPIESLFWTLVILDAAVRGRPCSWTTPFEDAVIRGRLVHRQHCSRSPLFEGDMHLDKMILKTKSVAFNHKSSNRDTKKLVRRLTLISHSPLICTLPKKWFSRWQKSGSANKTYLRICKAFGHNLFLSQVILDPIQNHLSVRSM